MRCRRRHEPSRRGEIVVRRTVIAGRGWLVILLAWGLGRPSSLAAAVAGVPEAPRPGRCSEALVQFGNDLFGLATNRDDHRTVSMGGYFRLGPWVYGGDMSLFTRRGPTRWEPDPPGEEGRIDQVTLVAGRQWSLAGDGQAGEPLCQLGAGIGMRLIGKAGGEAIQNGMHEATDDMTLHLPYEDTRRQDPLVWGSLSLGGTWRGADAFAAGGIGWWVRARALAVANGVVDGHLDASIVASRAQFTLWGGLGYALRDGYDFDATLREASRQERGAIVFFGFASGPLVVEMNRNIETGYGSGSIGVQRIGGTTAALAEAEATLALEVGTVFDAFPLVAAVRWSPPQVRALFGQRQRTSLGLFYAHGGVTGSVVGLAQREVAVGIEIETPFIDTHPWINARFSLGGGWREDRVQGDDGSLVGAGAPVVICRVGVGIDMGGVRIAPGRNRLMLTAGYVGSLPLNDARVNAGGERVRVLRPNHGLMVGLAATIAYR